MKTSQRLRVKLTEELLSGLYRDQNLTLENISYLTGYSKTHIYRHIKKYGLIKPKHVLYRQIDESRRDTFKRKYGVEHYMQSKDGYKKYQEKLKINYGVSFIAQLDKVKEKYKNTCIEKYGVDHTLKVPSIRKQQRNTLINNFGSYDQFKKEMSAISAQNASDSVPHKCLYDGRLGKFWTRSKLEFNVLCELEKLSNIKFVKYERKIKVNGKYRLPDFELKYEGINIMVEAKYHRYTLAEPYNSPSWTTKYFKMWENAKIQLEDLRSWCNANNYLFFIATEINYKKINNQIRQSVLDLLQG